MVFGFEGLTILMHHFTTQQGLTLNFTPNFCVSVFNVFFFFCFLFFVFFVLRTCYCAAGSSSLLKKIDDVHCKAIIVMP